MEWKHAFHLNILLLAAFIVQVCSYKNFSLANDRVCSPLAKKRKIDLGYEFRSGMIIRDNNILQNWVGKHDFKCRFEVNAISKDGLIIQANISNLKLNDTTGECIDYLQLKLKDKEARKICITNHLQQQGEGGSALSVIRDGVFIDPKGEVDIYIFVSKQSLLRPERIKIELLITSFKPCSKYPQDYFNCGNEVCIWAGYFHDGQVNCPFTDCLDETQCDGAGVVDAQTHPSPTPFVSVLIVMAIVTGIGMIAYFVIRHKSEQVTSPTPSPVSTYFPDIVAVETQSSRDTMPTAPSDDEYLRDPPPSYDSLFPKE